MPTEHTKELYQLILQIRPFMKILSDTLENELKKNGISVEMRVILEQLNFNNELARSDISRLLFLEETATQPIISKLKSQNLIAESKAQTSNYSEIYNLTQKGKTLIRDIKLSENENLDLISDDFDLEEIRVSLDVLNKLKWHFKNYNEWQKKEIKKNSAN